MKSNWLALAAIAAAWAVPAQAQMVRAQDPGSVVRALQDGGYAAKLGTDQVGDPMITSGVGGTTFQIFFYNCTDHAECATVQFHSGYDFTTSPGLETINEWNRNNRFGRAYLDDEDDPIIEMDVDLDDGGLSPLLFIDNIEFWESTLSNFEKHIGFRAAAAATATCVPSPAAGHSGARSLPWYINNDTVSVRGTSYVKYGLPRVLGPNEVEQYGSYKGGFFYGEAGADSREVLYLLTDLAGCEFQPYQESV
ncbi:MAG TPA: YbjN domain-containing protein [Croceibacterium sp.]|nr:YbjN domain-containing protein [Croceibacterium sp.]